MKSKLFKKFLTIDWSEYWSAIIQGEYYLSVVAVITFSRKWLWFRWKHTETQYQKTIKMLPQLMEFLGMWSKAQDLEEENCKPDLDYIKQTLKRDIITEMNEMREMELHLHPEVEKEIIKAYSDRLLDIYDMFDSSWLNPTVQTFLDKGWVVLFQIYAGVATRDIYLARTSGDLLDFMSIKLFGKENDNDVSVIERILFNKEIIDMYLLSVMEEKNG